MMKNTERRPFEPKQTMLTKLSPLAKVVLPTSLRMLVVEQEDPATRKIYEEAAQTMELLIQAVERGSDSLYAKGKK